MERSDHDSADRTGSAIAGLTAGGALLTGAGAIFGAFVESVRGEFIGGAIYLVAAAVAFGLLANAVYRR
jgi:hypothetical protein